jgi:hypothetical protein
VDGIMIDVVQVWGFFGEMERSVLSDTRCVWVIGVEDRPGRFLPFAIARAKRRALDEAKYSPASERWASIVVDFLWHRRHILGGRRSHFDHLLRNDNQAPQGFQVQACLTPDGFGLRAVVAVFPA